MKNGNGTALEYNVATKKIIRRYTIKNGQKDGVDTSYFQDGDLSSEVNWKNGTRNGSTTTWDREGRLTSKIEYQRDKMHGPYYQRNWSGEKSDVTNGQYCRGHRCGDWIYVDYDGGRREEKFSLTGALVSKKHFSAAGKLTSQWPPKNKVETYESCSKKMLFGACCQAGRNLPAGARICSR